MEGSINVDVFACDGVVVRVDTVSHNVFIGKRSIAHPTILIKAVESAVRQWRIRTTHQVRFRLTVKFELLKDTGASSAASYFYSVKEQDFLPREIVIKANRLISGIMPGG